MSAEQDPKKESEETTRDGGGTEFKSHESYGTATFYNTSTRSSKLFGSSVPTDHMVSLVISKAEVTRDYHRDRILPGGEMIRIDMTQAQFGQLISTFSKAEGTPVTISRFNGKMMAPPPWKSFQEKTHDDFKKEAGRLGNKISALGKTMNEILTKKGTVTKGDRKSLAGSVNQIIQELKQNIPFFQECFMESLEELVSHAKTEIAHSVEQANQQLGEGVASRNVRELGDGLSEEVTDISKEANNFISVDSEADTEE
jgi:hypothetical protein